MKISLSLIPPAGESRLQKGLTHLAGRKNPFAEDILQVEMNGLGLV